MQLTGLGWKSELVFLGFDGQVDDRGSYLVMRTLTNPGFFWGNLLVFNRPPKRGDFKDWVALFKKEFPDPKTYHVTLAWDPTQIATGDASEFLANGYELEAKAVLSAGPGDLTPPPKFNEELEVMPLKSATEWEEMIQLQVRSAHDNLPREEWEKFYRTQSLRYQAMEKAGLGHWYGGKLNGKIVAGLGVFHREGVGRFQIVCTDPNFRRQGLCGTLVYQSAQHAFATMNVRELVMCADPDYYALKIYESVGFQRRQTEYGVYWWDRSRSAAD